MIDTSWRPTGAWFSADRKYRFGLWRIWDEAQMPALIIGLNPSTADEAQDDPTIRRVMGFARRWGHGGIYMGNLHPQVATDPQNLSTASTKIFEENLQVLETMMRKSGLMVAAWGAFQVDGLWLRIEAVKSLCQKLGVDMYCLGKNANGSPKHPLYLPYGTQLEIYYTCAPQLDKLKRLGVIL